MAHWKLSSSAEMWQAHEEIRDGWVREGAEHALTQRHLFVMKDTSLIEGGTHDELVAPGGFDAELIKIQFAGQTLGPTA